MYMYNSAHHKVRTHSCDDAVALLYFTVHVDSDVCVECMEIPNAPHRKDHHLSHCLSQKHLEPGACTYVRRVTSSFMSSRGSKMYNIMYIY